MAITNYYRWVGGHGIEWTYDDGFASNWVSINNPGAPPNYPDGLGDLAVFDLGGDITVTGSAAGAEEIQIVSQTTVTFSSGNFGAGFDEQGGMLIDENATLVIASGVGMSDSGSLDIIGLTSSGSLEVQPGGGFGDLGMIVGADENSQGDITVDGAFFSVAQSGSGAPGDGELIVGEDGEGTIDVSGGSQFYSAIAILGKNDGSTGTVTVSDSIWAGSSLTVGLTGTGIAKIEDGSTAVFNSVTVGPNGDLSVSAVGGLTTQFLVNFLTLAYGTIDVTGGGELVVGAGVGDGGAVAIGGATLVGLGTINANIDLSSGSVQALQPLPGTLTINGNVNGIGEIDPLMTLEVNGTIDDGVNIVFNPNGLETDGDLVLDVPRGDQGTIIGFDVGDTIDIEGLHYSNAVFTPGASGQPGTLTLSGGPDQPLDLKVEGDYAPDSFVATPGETDTIVTQVGCFLAGTRILTDGGEVAVEDLAIGDRVITHSSEARPIRWIGRRKLAARFADPLQAWPVRIKAGALAAGVPSRDLLLSPDHAVLVDDVLIQAGALVNGSSIVREARVPETFTYYHVELDDHSLILAENTPAETFVDNVDRLGFDNWPEYEALYPEGRSVTEMPYPRAKACRQVPRAIRERLASFPENAAA